MNDVEIKLQMYGDLLVDAPLSAHTTFKIGGKAKYFLYPKSTLGLMLVLDIAKENGLEVRIFGKGSNILASDEDYAGLILCLDRYFSDFYFEEENIKEELTGEVYKSGEKKGQVKTKQGQYYGKLTNLITRLQTKMDDKKYSFVFNEEKSGKANYINSFINEILNNDKKIKVIDLSEVPSDMLPIIIGVVTRLVYDV